MTKLERIKEDIGFSACIPAGLLFQLFDTFTPRQIDMAYEFLFDEPERLEKARGEQIRRNLAAYESKDSP